MWPFNSPFPWQRGLGGVPSVRPGSAAAASPAGGAPTAPQGGMFNAWPTMLSGPQPNALPPGGGAGGALPGPGGVPALPAPAGAGLGGLGAALSNMMKGGAAANAFSLFGSPQQSDDIKEQIRQQFLKAGRPDPFADPMAAQAAQGAIPDLGTTPAYGSTPMTVQPGIPMPHPRPPNMQIPLPQPRPFAAGGGGQDPMSYYNGPGSMSFGAGDGAPGAAGSMGQGAGILAALFGGR